jgi:hypothetical protein
MKYFTPSKWISRIMVSWGIVTICTAAVSSYKGLIICRVFLGAAEAGFFVSPSCPLFPLCLLTDQPGIICYLCYFYKPAERATRMAIFSASIAVAG